MTSINGNYYGYYSQQQYEQPVINGAATSNNYITQPNKTSETDSLHISAANETCTDGSDDGRIGFGSKLWNITKGVAKTAVGGIKSMFTDSEGNFSLGKTLLSAGLVAACVAFPAVGLVACGLGVLSGAKQVIQGAKAAASATTDAEAKAAWQNIGGGGFTAALSAYGAKASYGAMKSSSTEGALAALKESGSKNPVKFAKAFIKDAKSSTSNRFTTIKSSIKTGAAKLKSNASELASTAKEKFATTSDKAKAGASDLKASAKAKASSAAEQAKAGLSKAKEGISDIKAKASEIDAKAVIKDLKASAKAKASTAAEQAKAGLSKAKNGISDIKTKAGEIDAKAVLKDLKAKAGEVDAKAVIKDLKTKAGEIDAKAALSDLKATAKAKASTVAEQAKAGLSKAKASNMGQSTKAFSQSMIDSLKGNLAKLDFSKISIKNVPSGLKGVYQTYVQNGFEAAANKYGYQSISDLLTVCGTAIITE